MPKRLTALIVTTLMLLSASSAFAKGESIVKIGSDVTVNEGAVVDDVVAIYGDAFISGRIENSLVVIGGAVELGPNSYIGKDAVIVGGDLIRDPAAFIGGKITQVYMPHFIPSIKGFLKGGWIAVWATISVLVLLGFLGLAILLAALIPEHIGTAVNALERSFAAMLAWGVVWTVLIVPIAVLLAISIIGVILIPLEILLVVLAMIIGYIASAVFIGKNIILAFKKSPPPFIDAILGIVVLFLIGFVPMVGPIAKALFLTAGFGAVITTRFGTVK